MLSLVDCTGDVCPLQIVRQFSMLGHRYSAVYCIPTDLALRHASVFAIASGNKKRKVFSIILLVNATISCLYTATGTEFLRFQPSCDYWISRSAKPGNDLGFSGERGFKPRFCIDT